jgi:hypothetical protein
MAGERKGDWIQTYTGRRFWPADPRPEEVFIEDIAHALSMLCRFGGHCLRFYSVAEHSVLLSWAAPPEWKRWCLLHDATEAYLCDLPGPIKRSIHEYGMLEMNLMEVVAERFGLKTDGYGRMPREVKLLDAAILEDERVNMAHCDHDWKRGPGRLGVTPIYMRPAEAEAAFLNQFRALAIDLGE